MTAAGVLKIYIWFSIPVPKIRFDPPPQGKMLWCSNFRLFIKSINLDRCGNLIEKFNFVSTPWKIIIPIANNHPTHHHPQSLHTPPTSPFTSTPPTPAPTIKTTNNFTTHPHPITHLSHHHHPPHHHPLHNWHHHCPQPPPSHPIIHPPQNCPHHHPTPPPSPPHQPPHHPHPTPSPPTLQTPTHPSQEPSDHPPMEKMWGLNA